MATRQNVYLFTESLTRWKLVVYKKLELALFTKTQLELLASDRLPYGKSYSRSRHTLIMFCRYSYDCNGAEHASYR